MPYFFITVLTFTVVVVAKKKKEKAQFNSTARKTGYTKNKLMKQMQKWYLVLFRMFKDK